MKLNHEMWFGLMLAASLPLSSLRGQNPTTPPSAPAAVAPATDKKSTTNSLPPNVQDVIKLVNAHLGNDLVLAFVNSAGSRFNLSVDNILELKKLGISAAIVTAMLSHDAELQNPYPAPPPGPGPAGQYGQPGQPLAAPQPVPLPSTPAPLVEYVPMAPGPEFYWAPGYWGWDNGWIWIGGGWNWRGGWGWDGYRGWGGYHGWGANRGWDGYRGGPHGGGSGHPGSGAPHGSGGEGDRHGGHK